MFGMNQKTIDRIMAIVSNSDDKLNVKTYIARDKAGPRAIAWLRKAIEYARHEGSAKHEDDSDEFDKTKDMDLEASARNERPHERPQEFDQPQDDAISMEKPIKECTFRDYLMELMVSDDPAQAMVDVKTAARSPDRFRKQQQAAAVTKERDVKQATDDPNQREKLQLIQKQKIAAQAAKQLAAKEKKEAMAAGAEADMGAARPGTGMM